MKTSLPKKCPSLGWVHQSFLILRIASFFPLDSIQFCFQIVNRVYSERSGLYPCPLSLPPLEGIVIVINSIYCRALGCWSQMAQIQIPSPLLSNPMALNKLYNICLKPQFPHLQNSTCLLVLSQVLSQLLHAKHLK